MKCRGIGIREPGFVAESNGGGYGGGRVFSPGFPFYAGDGALSRPLADPCWNHASCMHVAVMIIKEEKGCCSSCRVIQAFCLSVCLSEIIDVRECISWRRDRRKVLCKSGFLLTVFSAAIEQRTTTAVDSSGDAARCCLLRLRLLLSLLLLR